MKVLLLDTAFAAAPIYNFLIESGHEVWVMGNRPGDVLARKAGDHWIEVDYSKKATVECHVARLGISHVVPGCTDVSMDTCLQLSVGSDLRDSAETNRILSDKEAFRTVCAQIDLPAPRVIEESKFPLQGQFICKPVDAFSGRGISIFEGADLKALHSALGKARQASPSSKAIIETFVNGDLYSCSAFVDHGKLTDAFYVREASSANPFAVDTSYVAYDLPSECIHLIEKSLEKLCAFLKLANGLLHAQFILSDSQPFIIEVSRRCPGDLYPLLIEYSTGFQYAAKYASYFLGEKLDARKSTRRHILRHTVSADNEATFEGLIFKEAEPVISFFPISAIGEKLRARQASRAGILFSERSNYADLRLAYEAFLQRRAYILTTPTPHATITSD
jgi:hypothetical protein